MASKFIVAFALLGCLAFASAQKTATGNKTAAAQRQATVWPVQKHAPLTGLWEQVNPAGVVSTYWSMAHVKGGKDYRGAGALLTPAAAGGVGNSTALQAVLVSTRPNSKGRFPTWSAAITAPSTPGFPNATLTIAQLNATLLYAYNNTTPVTTPPSAVGAVGMLRRVGPVLAKA